MDLERREVREPERRLADRLPERTQSLDPLLRRVAAIKAELIAPIEMPADPIGMKVGLRQRLVDAGLIEPSAPPPWRISAMLSKAAAP